MKVISTSGFLAHEGHNYHVGEIFAGKRIGLRRNTQGQTELHFANVHLGNLVYDPAERFRPPAYIAPPDRNPLAKSTTTNTRKCNLSSRIVCYLSPDRTGWKVSTVACATNA